LICEARMQKHLVLTGEPVQLSNQAEQLFPAQLGSRRFNC